jgi:hypothetical protein
MRDALRPRPCAIVSTDRLSIINTASKAIPKKFLEVESFIDFAP